MIRIGLRVIPLALVAISCGSDDPQGQFVDGNKNNNTDSIDNVKRYILNAPPTKWQPDWSTENIVIFHWRGEPDNLHPTNGASNPRRMIQDYTQRFLVNLDFEKLSLRPDLAVALPTVSDDGLVYSYELRKGVTWDDGSPLSVDDVIFTMNAYICPNTNNPQYKSYFEYLKKVEKDPTDPMKFKMIMRGRYLQNVALFGDVPILEENFHDKGHVLRKYTIEQLQDTAFGRTPHPDIEAWANEFNDPKYGREIEHLNGLGPYKVTRWDDGQALELSRKKDHWTFKIKDPGMYDASLPDKIICRLVNEENAILVELKSQKFDVSAWISTHGLIELQKDTNFNRNYHSAFVMNFDWQYIGLNLKPEAVNRTPFFTDKKVRRAIAHLVPADEMNEAYLEGQASRMVSNVPSTRTQSYNNDLKPIEYDIEKAKKLLDEAGWKDTDGDNVRDKVINGKKTPFEFEFSIMTGNVAVINMANDIQASMYKAGIKVNVKQLEFVRFYEQLQQHEFDMYFGAWSGSSMPEDFKQTWHSSSWENGGSNFVGFDNPKADALIDSIRITIVDSLRYPLEKELQALIYDEQPYVFMYMVPRKVAIHKRFDHAEMFWEKPGVYLSWLKLLSPSTMPTTTTP
ncbi:MAG TPA: ABC transporter substrate-binding protein [Bacteroidia bacterium]|nr:ABC transporter substrate-binding protein [Bacteroidia bacterium]